MLKNAEGPCCTSPLLMRSVLKGRASPLAATVDGCFERALIHFRPTLDLEPLGLSEELLLGSFLTLRHAPPLSSSVNYTDALPRRVRPKRPARRATEGALPPSPGRTAEPTQCLSFPPASRPFGHDLERVRRFYVAGAGKRDETGRSQGRLFDRCIGMLPVRAGQVSS